MPLIKDKKYSSSADWLTKSRHLESPKFRKLSVSTSKHLTSHVFISEQDILADEPLKREKESPKRGKSILSRTASLFNSKDPLLT
jgi:hypothetical protein